MHKAMVERLRELSEGVDGGGVFGAVTWVKAFERGVRASYESVAAVTADRQSMHVILA